MRYARWVLISFVSAQLSCGQMCRTKAPTDRVLGPRNLSLATATSFHEKLSFMLRGKGLTLKYRGGLADNWRTGLKPPFDDYRLWSVFAYRTIESAELVGGLPSDHVEDLLREKLVTEEHLFDLKLGDFPNASNTMTVSLGSHTLGLKVIFAGDGGRLDDKVMPDNHSIRDLLQLVEEPSSMDSAFGIQR